MGKAISKLKRLCHKIFYNKYLALAMENHKKECKMRKIVFVIIFCFIISYCKAQIDTINKNIMEYFDINKYKDWK